MIYCSAAALRVGLDASGFRVVLWMKALRDVRHVLAESAPRRLSQSPWHSDATFRRVKKNGDIYDDDFALQTSSCVARRSAMPHLVVGRAASTHFRSARAGGGFVHEKGLPSIPAFANRHPTQHYTRVPVTYYPIRLPKTYKRPPSGPPRTKSNNRFMRASTRLSRLVIRWRFFRVAPP